MKYKYIPLIIGLGFITLSNSNAQNLNFGVFAGYDIVNIHEIPLHPNAKGPPYNPMKSYNLNCFISYKSKSFWGLSVEPGFMQKGGFCGVNNSCRWELNYLQIPVLADIYIFHRFFLSVGPEFSYMTSAKAVSDYQGHNQTDDIYSIYNKKFELSGFIGINCMITNVIGIGLGYNHGLTYIDKVPLYDYPWKLTGWTKLYNQYLQIKMSFRIQSIELRNIKK